MIEYGKNSAVMLQNSKEGSCMNGRLTCIATTHVSHSLLKCAHSLSDGLFLLGEVYQCEDDGGLCVSNWYCIGDGCTDHMT